MLGKMIEFDNGLCRFLYLFKACTLRGTRLVCGALVWWLLYRNHGSGCSHQVREVSIINIMGLANSGKPGPNYWRVGLIYGKPFIIVNNLFYQCSESAHR